MADDLTAEHEIELIRRIGNGDKRAFEQLFGVYGKRIFRYAARMTGDVSVADEVTSDVMMEVWKSAARFEARSRPSTWIIGITRHRALNAMRGKRMITVDLDSTPEIADRDASGETIRNQADERRLVRRALATLSSEHREVMELTFYHGHSYQEIAAIVGCPENTVKTRMFHAKRQLKAALEKSPEGRALGLGAVS